VDVKNLKVMMAVKFVEFYERKADQNTISSMYRVLIAAVAVAEKGKKYRMVGYPELGELIDAIDALFPPKKRKNEKKK